MVFLLAPERKRCKLTMLRAAQEQPAACSSVLEPTQPGSQIKIIGPHATAATPVLIKPACADSNVLARAGTVNAALCGGPAAVARRPWLPGLR